MSFKFKLPKRLPEANVQAELYMRCHFKGIPCLLEYRVKGSRFDAVIYRDGEIICIVEVKNLSAGAIKRRESGYRKYRQIERYEQFGVPVIGLWSMQSLNSVMAEIEGLYGQ